MRCGQWHSRDFPQREENASVLYLISDFHRAPGRTDIIVGVSQRRKVNQRGCHTPRLRAPSPGQVRRTHWRPFAGFIRPGTSRRPRARGLEQTVHISCRRSRYAAPQKVPLWHKGYFELKATEKPQRPRPFTPRPHRPRDDTGGVCLRNVTKPTLASCQLPHVATFPQCAAP